MSTIERVRVSYLLDLGPSMFSFRSASLMALAVLTPVVGVSHRSLSASVTTRYRYESQTEQSLDLTAVGGGKQNTVLSRTGWLTVTLTDSAGGKVMRAVIDSISADAESREAMGAASLDSARGSVFTGFVAPDGEVSHFTMPLHVGALGALLGGSLDEFFPRVKLGWKRWERWNIATDKPQIVSNGQLMIKKATTYTARGSVTRDGGPVDAFDVTFSTTSSGTQQVGQSNAKVEGSSTGTWFVAPDGRFVGGTRSEKNDRTLMLTGAPAPVLVTAQVRTTISVIR